MLHKQLIVVEVHSIVELGEFQQHFDDLWFVVATQAVVLRASEDALNALVDHFWADGVLAVVEARVETGVLLGQNENSFELLGIPFAIR